MNQECVNCKLNRQCFSINNISNTKVCLKESTRYETYTMTPEEEIKWLRQCVRELQEERESLKSKLDDNTKIYLNTFKYASECETKIVTMETQQKEFIKYLEDCINELKKESINKFENTLNLGIADITKEILSKYKKIIGSKNNGN